MRTYQIGRLRGLAILAASALLTSHAWTQTAQTSVGRGARDPFRPEVIVGSEGKGMHAGAGIPVDNMPIFATRDGEVPAGVQPLPYDIFSTRDFYQGPRALVRQPLLPLQLARGPRANLGRVRVSADRQ